MLAENDDFAEYIGADDLKYLEDITDIYVEYDTANGQPRDFSITIEFGGELVPGQTIVKLFKTVLNEVGEESLESESVSVEWPEQLKDINPKLIKEGSAESGLSASEKKNYRLGMKSFFAFFAWTGTKPGKEFRSGEDLARLIVDNLFPFAVKYYSEALPGNSGDEDEEEEEDSEEGEELDISDDEPEKKKQKTT